MTEAKDLINNAKNVYILAGESHEAQAAALALFYTLRQAEKNANVVADAIPDRLAFLSPSLDFVSFPKNFVVSVPNSVAEVSQIYYEKTPEAIKVHFTVEKGNIKKESLSCYFQEAKPDLVLTLGVQDYQKELENKLDSYGFLLDAPVVNIDNQPTNKKFGRINIVEEKPLAVLAAQLAEPAAKEPAQALLAALVLYTENFQNNVGPEAFEAAGKLMRAGADIKEITRNLYRPEPSPMHAIHSA